ncbi:GerAB/ArcD/ProY family transporter [Paenibacillus methanolicus]|uniref:Spore germination protein KB n=1 Tax=Paenibacillus methanolicus TaxID=582686 RepID=A0A5S5BXY8_9BACL|nr:endospore germination permease [Paenibacillus methanolicus]TYP71907.1 spore germination protein KB [Paenibacillus methanolicus]
MLEKGRISALQLGMMLYLAIGSTALLIVPGITAQFAKQDLWISPIWGALSGYLMLVVAYYLGQSYPNKTIIQYSEQIVGRIPGQILGAITMFFFLHDNSMVIREFGEFLHLTFLSRTPLVFIMVCIVVLCAYAVNGGIEVIGRCGQIFMPVVLMLFVWIALMLIPQLDPMHLYPVLEKGLTPSLMGSIVPHAWFVSYGSIAYFLPYVEDKRNVLKWGSLSIIVLTLTMVMTNLVVFFLFGHSTPTYVFPVFYASTYISVLNFFEHLDAVVLVIWVSGGFVQVAYFYYVLVLGTSQLLRLSDYRPMVIPLGVLLVLFSMWSAPNLQKLIDFFRTTVPFYFWIVQGGIPLLLLAVHFIRRRFTS